MDNESLSEKLSALLDGELPDGERRELEALIASDPAVAREWNALTRMDRLFREMPRYEAPEAFAVRLRSPRASRTVSFGRPRSSRRAAWPLLAAAAAFLLVFGLIVLQLPDSNTFTMTRLEPAPAESASEPGSTQERLADRVPAGDLELRQETDAGVALPSPPAAPPSPPAAPDPAARMRREAESMAERVAEAPALAPSSGGAVGRDLKADNVGGRAMGAWFNAAENGSAGDAPQGAAGAPGAAPSDVQTAPASPAEAPPPSYGARAVPEKSTPYAAAAQSAPVAQETSAETLEAAGMKRVGTRVFELRNETWTQTTYTDQTTVAVERDSEALSALIASDPALAETLRFSETIIFETGGAWYRVPPVTANAQASTPAQP